MKKEGREAIMYPSLSDDVTAERVSNTKSERAKLWVHTTGTVKMNVSQSRLRVVRYKYVYSDVSE